MSARPRSQDLLNRAASYNLAKPPDLADLARGANETFLQSRLYEREHDLETAYVLYRRAYM